jgi:hypothetical protein
MEKEMTNTIHEPARDVPVAHECDVCVIGGTRMGAEGGRRASAVQVQVSAIPA